MWFRSCWIPCSAALVLLAQSCSSTVARPGTGVRLGVDRIWDFQGSLFCEGSLVENGDPSRDWARKLGPRAVFAHYCRAGQPLTDLREVVRFVIPTPPPNIPLDKAARGRQRLLSQVRGLLRRFYAMTSLRTGEGRAPGRSCGVDSARVPYFYGLDAPEKGAASSLDAVLRAREALPDWDDLGSFLLVRAPEGSPRIYLTRDRALRFEVPGEEVPAAGGPVFSLADGRLSDPYATHWPGRGTLVASTGPVWFRVGDATDEPRAVFPLREASLGDAGVLKEFFTLAVPPAIQQREFGAERVGLNPDGGFNLSALVRERDQIWDVYFRRYTRLREAVNEDPRVIDFEVSLDLGLFCRYGRAAGDLVTR